MLSKRSDNAGQENARGPHLETNPDDALAEVSRTDWELLAQLANRYRGPDDPETTADAFKSSYVDAIREYQKNPVRAETPSTAAVSPLDTGCFKVSPFDIPVIDSVTITVEGVYCPGTAWVAEIFGSLKVAGSTVWKDTVELTPGHYSIRYQPDLKAAKADFTVGIFGNDHCLRIFGNACYWWGHWNCSKDFDTTVHCFG